MSRAALVLPGVLLLLAACVPTPPGLPPTSTEIVYVDAGAPPPEPVAAPQNDEERARIKADLDRIAEERKNLEGGGAIAQPTDGKDPLKGSFSLADATASLPGSGPLLATIQTSMGPIRCKLFEDKAPNTVANFVGLANGLRPFKSQPDGRWVKRPFYDGTTFHRIIKGFMIQGGDPNGDGSGEPGYVIPDEIWPGAKHDRAGLLCMANRGKNTNGGQFFITDAAVSRLDGNYTIFGECSPTSLVHSIATVAKNDVDRPLTPVKIERVFVVREAR